MATLIGLSVGFERVARAETLDEQLGFSVPYGVNYRGVAVASSGSLTIGDRATLLMPGGAGYASSSSTGTSPARYGFDVRVGSIASSHAVEVFDRAAVNGSITAGGSIAFGMFHRDTPAEGNVTVAGPIEPHSIGGAQVIPVTWSVGFETSSDNRTIQGGTTSLAPGAYGHLNVHGGTLALQSGTYFVDRLTLEPPSQVTVNSSNGPVIIYVRSSFIHRGTWTATPEDVFVGYLGSNLLALEKTFRGTVVAPNARIRLAVGGMPHEGAILGKETQLDPDVSLAFRPFSRWDVLGLDDGGLLSGPSVPTTLGPPIHLQPASCWAPWLSVVASGDQLESMHYVSPDLAAGVCEPQYCDPNGNVIAAPSEEDLNTPPPSGSTCPAVGLADADCPIDPTTLSGNCNADADCEAGFRCSARCVDIQCSQVEHRCGKPAESCSALPAEANCEEYTLCPDEGAVGAPDVEALASQLAPTMEPSLTGTIEESDRDALPLYEPVNAILCSSPQSDSVELADGSSKPAEDGNDQWGIYLQPTTSFNINPVKRSDGIGELRSLGGSLEFAAGVKAFGHQLEVLSAEARLTVDTCGVTGTLSGKLFGEAVVTVAPGAAELLHLATDPQGNFVTPSLPRSQCIDAQEATQEAIAETRKTYLMAKAVNEYYFQNGLTPALCHQVQRELSERAKDEHGNDYDCNDLDAIDPVGQVNIINAWKEEYDGKVNSYLNFADELRSSQQTIQTSGTISLFDTPHPYHIALFHQQIPAGPITIQLAVDGYGYWNISGGLQLGLGIDGNFETAGSILWNALDGQAPRLGDIRAYGGPVVTPSAGVGALIYAGVGIPGISIGVEGKVDLLEVAVPGGVVAAAMRLSEDDTRSTVGTEYEGPQKAGLLAANYRWVTGWQWSQELSLSALKGQLDLAARIRLLFFSKTFRKKLFSWPGWRQDYVLVGAAGGDPLNSSGDYGQQGDRLVYNELAEVALGNAVVNPSGPGLPSCSPQPPR